MYCISNQSNVIPRFSNDFTQNHSNNFLKPQKIYSPETSMILGRTKTKVGRGQEEGRGQRGREQRRPTTKIIFFSQNYYTEGDFSLSIHVLLVSYSFP